MEPELFRVIGNGVGSLADGSRIGLHENILEFTLVPVESNILATVTERGRRSGSLLLRRGLSKKLDAFPFHPCDYMIGNPVVGDGEEAKLFTSLDY